jgi:hypothetical protein
METHNEPPLLRLRMPLQSFAWVDARNQQRAASVGHDIGLLTDALVSVDARQPIDKYHNTIQYTVNSPETG